MLADRTRLQAKGMDPWQDVLMSVNELRVPLIFPLLFLSKALRVLEHGDYVQGPKMTQV